MQVLEARMRGVDAAASNMPPLVEHPEIAGFYGEPRGPRGVNTLRHPGGYQHAGYRRSYDDMYYDDEEYDDEDYYEDDDSEYEDGEVDDYEYEDGEVDEDYYEDNYYGSWDDAMEEAEAVDYVSNEIDASRRERARREMADMAYAQGPAPPVRPVRRSPPVDYATSSRQRAVRRRIGTRSTPATATGEAAAYAERLANQLSINDVGVTTEFDRLFPPPTEADARLAEKEDRRNAAAAAGRRARTARAGHGLPPERVHVPPLTANFGNWRFGEPGNDRRRARFALTEGGQKGSAARRSAGTPAPRSFIQRSADMFPSMTGNLSEEEDDSPAAASALRPGGSGMKAERARQQREKAGRELDRQIAAVSKQMQKKLDHARARARSLEEAYEEGQRDAAEVL